MEQEGKSLREWTELGYMTTVTDTLQQVGFVVGSVYKI